MHDGARPQVGPDDMSGPTSRHNPSPYAAGSPCAGLAGTIPSLTGTAPTMNASFDWGLPFFYGRRVAYAIEGAATSVGTGPYIAF